MIVVENLSVRVGTFALEGISFQVGQGQYGVLMGRTGSGKTTILEAICGLKPLAAGCVRLMETDVTGWKPADRGIGFVPQEGAVFSTMSVRDNLAFGLVVRKWKPAAIAQRVDELAQLLGIGHLLDRRPVGLSGGETQRVALGRALAFRPDVLCLDEPLSALDDQTRLSMYELLESVGTQTGVTTLHITHNVSEAIRLADTVLLLEDGRVTRLAPDELDRRHRPGFRHP